MEKLSIAEKIRKNTAEKLVLRAFCALFLSCILFLFLAYPVPFDSVVFFKKVGFLPFTGAFFGFYAVLSVVFTLVDSLKLERLILLISFIGYALITLFETDAIWYGFGACLVLLVICVYVFKDEHSPALRRDINKKIVVIIAVAAGLYFAVFVGVQTVCKYLALSTPNYDFGIFSQMFYYMKNTFLPYATAERDMLLSHFAVHISPVFYLFLPFYMIYPSPETLMVCQAVLLASGVIPVVMICKKLGLSNKASAAFSLIYALYPALCGGCFFDLHENKFLAPLLLWLFYFIVKNKWYGIAVFSVLVMLVKEDAPVYVAFAGLFVLAGAKKKDKFKGLAMISGAVVYFVFAVLMLNRFGLGTMDERFYNYMSDQSDSLWNVAANVFKDPAYVIRQIFDTTADPSVENKMEFLLRMLIPLGFLPFFTKKLSRYILLLPLVLINLMPEYVYQHSIFFQYTYGSLAFLMFLSILNYSELSEKIKRTMGTYAVIASVFVCAQSVWPYARYTENYATHKEYCDTVRAAIDTIPEEASVAAETFYCAAASQRKELYDLDGTSHTYEVDYIILDLRFSSGQEKLRSFERSGDYSEYYRFDGWIAIYKRR